MPTRDIVTGQKVDPARLEFARELRRQMTEEECTLWEHLRGNSLGGLHFRRQQVIDGYIADFYCHGEVRSGPKVQTNSHPPPGTLDFPHRSVILESAAACPEG